LIKKADALYRTRALIRWQLAAELRQVRLNDSRRKWRLTQYKSSLLLLLLLLLLLSLVFTYWKIGRWFLDTGTAIPLLPGLTSLLANSLVERWRTDDLMPNVPFLQLVWTPTFKYWRSSSIVFLHVHV